MPALVMQSRLAHLGGDCTRQRPPRRSIPPTGAGGEPEGAKEESGDAATSHYAARAAVLNRSLSMTKAPPSGAKVMDRRTTRASPAARDSRAEESTVASTMAIS